jgi:sialate O-acetylesterase
MKSTFLMALTLAVVIPCRAEVRLPKIFSSHAVLQRDQAIHIWGWSEPGENVTVTMQNLTRTATGDRLGHWEVTFLLRPPAARIS